MKQRYICALTLILIIIIVGLHQFGVALFQYKGKKEGTFEAIILSEPEKKEYVKIYKAKIENRIFLLYIKSERQKLTSYKERKSKLEIGTIIKIQAKLNEPKVRTNYKGFDYDLYLKSKGISGIFKVENYQIISENSSNSLNFQDSSNTSDPSISSNNLKFSAKLNSSIFFNKSYTSKIKFNFIEILQIKSERFFQRIRDKIKKIYEEHLPKDTSSLLEALTIGDKSDLDDNIIENFRKASLSHVLAISGTHFSYIILAIALMSKALRRKRMSKILLIIIIIFFIKLTGESPSVMRAGIMCIVGAIASLTKRKNDVLNSIAISLLIQIIINPYVIFDMGLILSYSGVIGIIYLYKIVYKFLKLKIISVTISANIILIPIMIYNFKTISFSFIISNIFASILLGPIIIIGYIVLIIRVKPLFFLLNILITLLSRVSQIVSNFKFSNINIEAPSILSLIMYYIIVYIIYKKLNRWFRASENNKIKTNKTKHNKFRTNKTKTNGSKTNEIKTDESKASEIITDGSRTSENKINEFETNIANKLTECAIKARNEKMNKRIFSKVEKKVIAALLIIIVISNINFEKFTNNMYINFIDVSQGDACLIRQKTKVILIDGGGTNNQNNNYNVGKSILMPYLLARKIKTIDYMIFSHFDNDHCQGLIYVLENLKVKNVLIGEQYEEYQNYQKLKEVATRKAIKIYTLKKGDSLKLTKNLKMEVLWPKKEEMISENSINNNSLVLKITFGNFSILFTGDIEKIAEEKILKEYEGKQKLLQSTILKVAHHGSKTSSIKEFIQKVNPKCALIGVGKDNKFGHPSNITLETLKELNTKIYRTDQCGEISIKVTKQNYYITNFVKPASSK